MIVRETAEEIQGLARRDGLLLTAQMIIDQEIDVRRQGVELSQNPGLALVEKTVKFRETSGAVTKIRMAGSGDEVGIDQKAETREAVCLGPVNRVARGILTNREDTTKTTINRWGRHPLIRPRERYCSVLFRSKRKGVPSFQ